jgi:phage replication O-like protein O
MASPQRENGHTEIANELLEALSRFNMPGRQRRIFDVVLRKTWGWNKKSDYIPLSQFAKSTGIKSQHICDILKWLKDANVITRDSKGKTAIQKNYEKWSIPSAVLPPAGVPSTVLPPKGTATPAEGNQLLPPAGDSKETLSKDISQKTERGAAVATTPTDQAFDSTEIKERTEIRSSEAPASEIIPTSPVPRDEARAFFASPPETVTEYLVAKGIPENIVRREIAKFIAYWTEPNANGTKQRWQLQKTFEVRRRLATWMMNCQKFTTQFNAEKKGITI